MSLDNCKRCGRLFQKHLSPLCQECFTYEQNLHMEIYRFIQGQPNGVTMEDIAREFKMPMREVEHLVFSGALGTANQLIRTQCALCKCETTFVNRIGYFCYACNKFVEREFGKIPESEQKIENILKGHSAFYKLTPEEEAELRDAVSKAKAEASALEQERGSEVNPRKHVERVNSRSTVSKYGFKRISNRLNQR